MKVKLRKDYQYYLPFIFGVLLFIIVFYFLVLDHTKTLKTTGEVLSGINSGDKLITDPTLAKIATNNPLVLGDETKSLESLNIKDPVVKLVNITDANLELVEIIDANTLITFKNLTDDMLSLVGEGGTWRAEIQPDTEYSQMFEKTGQFKFTINDNPIGVVRVR